MILAITPHSNSHTLHTIRSVQFRVCGNFPFANPPRFPGPAKRSLIIRGRLLRRQGHPPFFKSCLFSSLLARRTGATTQSRTQQRPRCFPHHHGNLRNRRIPCFCHYQNTPPITWQEWPPEYCSRDETACSLPGWMARAAIGGYRVQDHYSPGCFQSAEPCMSCRTAMEMSGCLIRDSPTRTAPMPPARRR